MYRGRLPTNATPLFFRKAGTTDIRDLQRTLGILTEGQKALQPIHLVPLTATGLCSGGHSMAVKPGGSSRSASVSSSTSTCSAPGG